MADPDSVLDEKQLQRWQACLSVAGVVLEAIPVSGRVVHLAAAVASQQWVLTSRHMVATCDCVFTDATCCLASKLSSVKHSSDIGLKYGTQPVCASMSPCRCSSWGCGCELIGGSVVCVCTLDCACFFRSAVQKLVKQELPFSAADTVLDEQQLMRWHACCDVAGMVPEAVGKGTCHAVICYICCW